MHFVGSRKGITVGWERMGVGDLVRGWDTWWICSTCEIKNKSIIEAVFSVYSLIARLCGWEWFGRSLSLHQGSTYNVDEIEVFKA